MLKGRLCCYDVTMEVVVLDEILLLLNLKGRVQVQVLVLILVIDHDQL